MTRTIQTELERTGLSRKKERRPSRFIDVAVEASYAHDIADKERMIFKRPIKEKRYRIRKGGEVRVVKIKTDVVSKDSAGYKILDKARVANIPMSSNYVKNLVPEINHKTVSAYLTWFTKAGIFEKHGDGRNITWEVKKDGRPTELLYADYMQFMAKSKPGQEKVKVAKKQFDVIDTTIPADEVEVNLSPLKDLVEAFKRMSSEGITIKIKISLE